MAGKSTRCPRCKAELQLPSPQPKKRSVRPPIDLAQSVPPTSSSDDLLSTLASAENHGQALPQTYQPPAMQQGPSVPYRPPREFEYRPWMGVCIGLALLLMLPCFGGVLRLIPPLNGLIGLYSWIVVVLSIIGIIGQTFYGVVYAMEAAADVAPAAIVYAGLLFFCAPTVMILFVVCWTRQPASNFVLGWTACFLLPWIGLLCHFAVT